MGPNRVIVSIGGDGMQWPDHHVFLINNTIVNADTGGTFINATAAIDLDVVNNLFIGPGAAIGGGNVMRMSHNLMTDTSVLVNAAAFDYHLALGSMPIDMGIDPGSDGAMSLAPVLEYVHPRATHSRSAVGVIDIGAYEFGNVAAVDGGGSDAGAGTDAGSGRDVGSSDAARSMTDAGATPPRMSGGCCGVAGRGASGTLTLASILLLAFARAARRPR